MSVESQVPDAGTPIFDNGGYINPVWHQFFFTLLRRTGGSVGVDSSSESARITVVEGRVSDAEQGIEGTVQHPIAPPTPFVELVTQPSKSRTDEIQRVFNHGVQNDPVLHDLASATAAGFMSATDKTKLDSVDPNAIYGSTSTGEYVKFADGTMIQKFVVASQSVAVVNAYASVFYGPATPLSWTYPVAFVGATPAVRVECYISGHLAYGVQSSVPTLTSSSFVIKDEQSYTGNFNLVYWAIGRWK